MWNNKFIHSFNNPLWNPVDSYNTVMKDIIWWSVLICSCNTLYQSFHHRNLNFVKTKSIRMNVIMIYLRLKLLYAIICCLCIILFLSSIPVRSSFHFLRLFRDISTCVSTYSTTLALIWAFAIWLILQSRVVFGRTPTHWFHYFLWSSVYVNQ